VHDGVRCTRVGEIDLPVVVDLVRRDTIPRREGEVGRAHVVARVDEAGAQRPADLPACAGDEDPDQR
jgi:hypothetical protein